MVEEEANMKSRKLYNTMAMVEDGNTFYDGLVIMLAKIVDYRQTSYIFPQQF